MLLSIDISVFANNEKKDGHSVLVSAGITTRVRICQTANRDW